MLSSDHTVFAVFWEENLLEGENKDRERREKIVNINALKYLVWVEMGILIRIVREIAFQDRLQSVLNIRRPYRRFPAVLELYHRAYR